MTFEELAKLMDGKTGPIDGENVDGELVIIQPGSRDGNKFFRVETHQHNGWLRINYIWEDGTREELFEKNK